MEYKRGIRGERGRAADDYLTVFGGVELCGLVFEKFNMNIELIVKYSEYDNKIYRKEISIEGHLFPGNCNN